MPRWHHKNSNGEFKHSIHNNIFVNRLAHASRKPNCREPSFWGYIQIRNKQGYIFFRVIAIMPRNKHRFTSKSAKTSRHLSQIIGVKRVKYPTNCPKTAECYYLGFYDHCIKGRRKKCSKITVLYHFINLSCTLPSNNSSPSSPALWKNIYCWK